MRTPRYFIFSAHSPDNQEALKEFAEEELRENMAEPLLFVGGDRTKSHRECYAMFNTATSFDIDEFIDKVKEEYQFTVIEVSMEECLEAMQRSINRHLSPQAQRELGMDPEESVFG